MHNALRYIGELAWVHKVITVERKFFKALLSIDTGACMSSAMHQLVQKTNG
jgi:hypothetical protein